MRIWELHSGFLKSFKAIQVEESLKVFEIIRLSVCFRKVWYSNVITFLQCIRKSEVERHSFSISLFFFLMILSRIFFNWYFFIQTTILYEIVRALVKRIKFRSGYNVGKKKVVEKWEWNYIWAELPHSFPSKINQDAPFKINQEKLSVNGD